MGHQHDFPKTQKIPATGVSHAHLSFCHSTFELPTIYFFHILTFIKTFQPEFLAICFFFFQLQQVTQKYYH